MPPSIPEASDPAHLEAILAAEEGPTSRTSDPFPAMTTQWNVPNTCTWTYNAASEPVPGATGAVAWLDMEPDPGATTLSCYPDGMFRDGRTGVFSPATCPSGWTTATVMVNTDEDHDHATTTAICCSSEYSLVDTICKRSIPTVLAVPVSYNETASTHEVLSSSTTTLYSATIAVYTIMAMFREDDKAMLGIGDEDDIDDEDRADKLSINAKIGIGVGAAVAGLVIIGGIILLILRLRHQSKESKNSHEMGSVRGRRANRSGGPGDRASTTSAEDNTSMRFPYDGGREPPPTYQASTGANSLSDDASSIGPPRDQIEYLRQQKDMIQRRIEELESIGTNESESQAQLNARTDVQHDAENQQESQGANNNQQETERTVVQQRTQGAEPQQRG